LVSIPIAVLLNGLALTLEEEKNAKMLLKQEQISLSKRNDDLKRKNNDLDNFIYTASHDLKSPISNIEGLVNILEIELSEEEREKVKDTIALINKSTHRFQQTINSLTEVSKAQQDEIEVSFENINLEKIFEDVKIDISLWINKYKPIFHTDFTIKEIRFSKKDITSILSNLLSNAIKYSSPNRPSEVWIKTYKEKDDFVLLVKDNGLGMQADYKEKLFKMFKRMHDHVEGTGIGLYIIKRIVENYGGKIEVESTKGLGSEFRVYLKLSILMAVSQ
jgi:signal transduction histidine kinase